ncbi:MAG: mechanosensitive ion channel family protein [bacterium]
MNAWDQIYANLTRQTAGLEMWKWFAFCFGIFVFYIVLSYTQRRTSQRLTAWAEKKKSQLDDLLVGLLSSTTALTRLALAAFIASFAVALPEILELRVHQVFYVLLFLQAGLWGNSLVGRWLETGLKTLRKTDDATASAMGVMRFFAQLILWSVIILLILQNLGIQVGPIIAALGVGGIAIGFALQKILGDIFCSVAILLDKPFEVGDFITVGDEQGSVERIGIKTTRVRSLSGEQIVFSNADLLGSRIRNHKRMNDRRVMFEIGVIYQTPLEKLEKIPGMVKQIIEAIAQTRFDRAHFKSYGDFSLDFEVVYYVLDRDYNLYMNIQQTINLEMFRQFKEQGIGFAYPTRTLYLSGQVGVKGSKEDSTVE